ncbi:hypothetical protein [Caproicibacter sp. BJN0012]|uniref:hypothetical protein n=1 Tax=Caproicibacter sp. BJN0012 TaxID=3110227 RepID=UPI002E1000AD
MDTGDRFVELYNDRDNLPEKCKIFAYPDPEKSIRDTLKQYQQLIDDAPVPQKNRPAKAEERS